MKSKAAKKVGRRTGQSIDILAAMERRGSITAEMRAAGMNFATTFRLAQLDPLRAVDLNRPMGGTKRTAEGPGLRQESARNKVQEVLSTVGEPGGSCLWHVVGWERSLKEWALEQGWNGRYYSQEAATGVLIAALGVLAGKSAKSAS